jgi:hypothetical protein
MVLSSALAGSVLFAIKWHYPILPGSSWKPVGAGSPVGHLVLLLAVSAGIPYLPLSTTGPLLQYWFSEAHPDIPPYRLYALSNLGSFLALLSYPFVVEPWFTLRMQAQLWFGGYCLFVAICGYCALRLRNGPSIIPNNDDAIGVADAGAPPGLGRYIFWLSFAACGSLLFLATTNQICQNVAVVPLLWVLPLSVYLLTLVICFERPKSYSRAVFHPMLVLGLAFAVFLLSGGVLTNLTEQVVGYTLILFVCCMVCHGELVRSKPSPEHLTRFYLLIASGGAMAGVFVVLIAPNVFTTFAEYQLSLWLTTLLMLIAVIHDKASWVYASRSGVLVIALGTALLPAGITTVMRGKMGLNYFFLLAIALLGMFVVMRKSAPGFAKSKQQAAVLFTGASVVLLSVIFTLSNRLQAKATVSAARNFYGILTVSELNRSQPEWVAYKLSHGLISHGFQFRSPSKNLVATSYYGNNSGVGRAIAMLRETGSQDHSPRILRFGIIGLGVGTLAAYAKPGDSIHFYEINPDVIRIAEDSNYFTYLSRCPAIVKIIPGDARLSMERELALGIRQSFNLLVVDAFNGDAPPIHLLTQQAFQLYLDQIAPDGVIAIHITNTFLDLQPVVAGIAQRLQLDYVFVHADGDGRETLYSDWMLVSRAPLPSTVSDALMNPKRNPKNVLWTDDYSNLFQVLR